MKLGTGILVAFLLATAGCGSGNEGGLQQQAGEIASDTQILKEAETAANQIIRNAADCEAVKANIEDVNRKLDEVEQKIQTATGRTTLETLRTQVKRIAETCGAM